VHTDETADSLARAVSATAITTGNDIYFASGRYRPGSTAGDRLLAHELAHVAQQRGATACGPLVVSRPEDPLELEAERRRPSSRVPALSIQRQAQGQALSWVDQRRKWVKAGLRDDNWDSPSPDAPGVFYILNGLSLDDMTRVLRALTPAERKKLSANIDEHGGGFDRTRLQLAFSNIDADAQFREASEGLHWAIRSGNFAGAFQQLAAAPSGPRARLLEALNRDALDALLANTDQAEGSQQVIAAINRARGAIGATSAEEHLMALIDGKDWKGFFGALIGMNRVDQLRLFRSNFAVLAQVKEHIDQAAGVANQDEMRYFVELASTT
jgi:hypothetical protein